MYRYNFFYLMRIIREGMQFFLIYWLKHNKTNNFSNTLRLQFIKNKQKKLNFISKGLSIPLIYVFIFWRKIFCFCPTRKRQMRKVLTCFHWEQKRWLPLETAKWTSEKRGEAFSQSLFRLIKKKGIPEHKKRNDFPTANGPLELAN